ncbi:eukaryotic membrane protein family-domain-containing protein [Apodospora peruviana]|uniref:Eukaryotic membrane protein family-domain-containing protein n=1 Tax=Apodospora peruviana TaxID=516989 RepID=A0AAE0M1T6_9PEZI|nr:eukaryotic membrane protein family-domain-containing protein [Apodospora peruviana]
MKETTVQPAAHLPSPLLTPSDPTPRPIPESHLADPEAVHIATNGVPTPDPSSDSHSDAERSSDAISSDSAHPEPVKELLVESAKTRSRSGTKTSNHDGIRRLSATKIHELTATPESLPMGTISSRKATARPLSASVIGTNNQPSMSEQLEAAHLGLSLIDKSQLMQYDGTPGRPDVVHRRETLQERPTISARTLSTPPTSRRKSTGQPPTQPTSARRNSFHPLPTRPAPLDLEGRTNFASTTPKLPAPSRSEAAAEPRPPSPIPPSIPLPPMSIPTVLQLELAGQRPSPLYIHHSYASDLPYESSAVKFERLKNFLLVPWYLERAITFGAFACLDAWLWTFTVLPMRFCIAISVLVRWWAYLVGREARWLVGFVWYGLGRMWKRGRRGRSVSNASSHTSSSQSRSRSRVREAPSRSSSSANLAATTNGTATTTSFDTAARRPESLRPNINGATNSSRRPTNRPSTGNLRHRRTKSSPSNLTSFHKADLLQGAIIVFSSIALMNLDASRMYHFIRAQSAIKLYAIYNLLEVGDRLLSALGQDIFECLFSAETLSRNSSGRSKIMLPFGMFLLALVYNILHSVTLFYQVIALNVAVNSYSNALLTLLMSNQFVEIKSTVFKRFEKENSFQLACADIVERFQLWIMLLIIGMRNVVEVGGLSVPGAGSEDSGPSSIPLHSASILPASFTILPSWLWSGEVLSPFFVVIGSEMIVDWIKHAYVNKFNNIKPRFYSRILDILCKDYYTNAFVTPSLTRRLGLPLLPLSCLFIRASVQIYNMFLATHLPTPLPPSTQTSLSVESATPSPAMVAALDRLDNLIRNALGRAVYGYPYADGVGDNATEQPGTATRLWLRWTSDDVIATATMVVVFLLVFLVLLVVKLVLGMALLRYSRDRYAKMKAKEHAIATGKAERESYDAKGRRVGGYGQVEVGEERRRWLFADDQEALRKLREKEKRAEKGQDKEKEKDFSNIMRYEMVAKRIW